MTWKIKGIKKYRGKCERKCLNNFGKCFIYLRYRVVPKHLKKNKKYIYREIIKEKIKKIKNNI